MLLQRLLLAIVLVVISATTVSAQIIGPGPKQGKLQIGAWWAFLEYDQLEKYENQTQWYLERNVKRDRAALVLRYGITNCHYLIMNFGILRRSNVEDGSAASHAY